MPMPLLLLSHIWSEVLGFLDPDLSLATMEGSRAGITALSIHDDLPMLLLLLPHSLTLLPCTLIEYLQVLSAVSPQMNSQS